MKCWSALLLFATCPYNLWPCICPPVEHACQAYKAVPIIFVGTVVGFDSREITGRRGSYSQRVGFEVTEPFKGVKEGGTSIIREHVGTSCPSTVPDFAIGGQYLIWAVTDDAGDAVVSDCNPTATLEKAASLVSELRELKAGGGGTYIFGNIYRNRIFPNGVTEEELANDASVPLPDIRVLVSGGEARYTARTDEHGLFVVPLPVGGSYRVDIDLPGSFIKHEPSSGIDLADHECKDMSVWTRYDFSFSGRVVDSDGNPLEGVPVQLLPENDRRSVARTVTSSRGEYTLSASEPGKYLIALNWDESPSEAVPVPTTLYPGVHDERVATVVQTSEAGRVELADFHVSTPTACKVQFRIEEGTHLVVKDAKILVKYFPEQFWQETDQIPAANLLIPGDAPVHVVASRRLSDQQELRSEVIEIRFCPAIPVILPLTRKIKVD